MLGLALPVFVEESLTALVGYTDWWLTGHFLGDKESLAAMTVMAYVMWLLPSLFAAIAIGATALTSRFVGAGTVAKAAQTTNQALLVGGAIAVVVTIVFVLFVRPFVGLLQLTGEAAELAIRYCLIVAPAIPAIMVAQVGVACLRGAGDTLSGFVAKSIVNVINIVLSTALVIGVGPLPKMGWTGLAIGTSCGHFIGGILVLVLLLRGRAGLKIRWSLLTPEVTIIRRLLRIGIPGGVDVLAILICHLIYFSLINRLGNAATAAHGLSVQIEALAYLPCSAFQVAAATMTGQFLGAGKVVRAVRGIWLTCAAGFVFMLLVGSMFHFCGSGMASFFVANRQMATAHAAGELLRIVSWATPSLAVVMILSGALRGAGDTRWPLAISIIGLAGLRIPLACWFAFNTVSIPATAITIAGWGGGIQGAWWAMVVDVAARAILVTWRVLQGGWQRQVV